MFATVDRDRPRPMSTALVNNGARYAGAEHPGGATSDPAEVCSVLLEVNVMGVLHCTQQALRRIVDRARRRRLGAIVNRRPAGAIVRRARAGATSRARRYAATKPAR